jgi:hypothetical protein
MTIMQDLYTVVMQTVNFSKKITVIFPWFYKIAKAPFSWLWNLLGKIKFKKSSIVEKPVLKKAGIIKRISYVLKPKAKLTYWLADEEVIVYIDDFKQKDKFKLIFRELLTGRTVMVNSANPINYRLEQLKPTDDIMQKEVQQDQRY